MARGQDSAVWTRAIFLAAVHCPAGVKGGVCRAWCQWLAVRHPTQGRPRARRASRVTWGGGTPRAVSSSLSALMYFSELLFSAPGETNPSQSKMDICRERGGRELTKLLAAISGSCNWWQSLVLEGENNNKWHLTYLLGPYWIPRVEQTQSLAHWV